MLKNHTKLTISLNKLPLNIMSRMRNINMRYPTIFEPAEEGGFNVFFPSFPGCVTFGRNFEEAKIKAKEVLELWLEELSFSGEEIPASRSYPIIDEVNVTLPSKSKILHGSTHH